MRQLPRIDVSRLSDRLNPGKRAELLQLVQENWERLAFDHQVHQIDIVQEGPYCQTTLLVAPKGIVARLDLSIQFHLERELNRRLRLESLILHELYHLSDRFDPAFAIEYHEEATVEFEGIRRHVNAVWDIYIERRKFRTYSVAPFATFHGSGNDPRQAVLENFQDVVASGHDEIAKTFGEIWTGNGTITHPQLIEIAKRIRDLPDSPRDLQTLLEGPQHVLPLNVRTKVIGAIENAWEPLSQPERRMLLGFRPRLTFVVCGHEPFTKRLGANGSTVLVLPYSLAVECDVHQLAAIISHEFAHVVLGHFGESNDRNQEFEADERVERWGLGTALLAQFQRELKEPERFALSDDRRRLLERRVVVLSTLRGKPDSLEIKR